MKRLTELCKRWRFFAEISPSSRSAAIGSSRDARCAGKKVAVAATAASATTAKPSVTGSCGFNPNSREVAVRAQRHAYPDFIRPPRHGVGNHPVQSHRRKQRREKTKKSGKRRHQPLLHQ